jgi:hypothetical protein
LINKLSVRTWVKTVYAWWRYYPLEWDTNPFYWRWLEIWRWDNASGSLVFCSSKGNKAYDEPLPESIYEPNPLCQIYRIYKHKSKSVHQLWLKDVYTVLSVQCHCCPQGNGDSFERFLIPQGLIRPIGLKKISKERVGYDFKIGWLY